jgi:autotransporter-associated beta strand protein
MNKLIALLIGAGLTFLFTTFAQAGSATWVLDPISGDWNTAANWTPMGVPNGPTDTATFGLSNTTDVSISEQTEVNGIVFTGAVGTNPYTITAPPGLRLTISGTGITNNTGTSDLQNFVTAGSVGPGGLIEFTNNATAGFNTHFTNNAGEAITGIGGVTFFHDSSTAANGTFINNGATVSGVGGGATAFSENSHAANGTFVDNGATVAGARGGLTIFGLNSHADSATLIANGGTNGGEGGTIVFNNNSDGGTSRVEVNGNGNLDISEHEIALVTIGSLEGNGNVFLGFNSLEVGGNNRDTTFSGVIAGNGELEKVGTGTFTLSGDNTYAGTTFIHRGALKVNGSIQSSLNDIENGGTLAGTGTVGGTGPSQGNVFSGARARVSPGDPFGTLTVTGDYSESLGSILQINIAGESADQFSVLNVLGNAGLGGILEPVLLDGFIPAVDQTFAFLFYDSRDGEFSGIKNVNFGNEHWEIIYEENMAILTAQSGAAAPDQGSTFLLLTLGLLGLVTYQRQLARKRS